MREISPEEKIYVVGDSNCNVFSGLDRLQRTWPHETVDVLPQFRVFRLGPATAHKFEAKTTRARVKFAKLLDGVIPKGAWVVFSIGEIDCRNHLFIYAEDKGLSWQEAAEERAERYFKTIKGFRDEGVHVAIYNVIPSTRSTRTSKQYPLRGTCLERNQMTRYFNGRLKDLCAQADLPFIRTFDSFVDAKGLTRMVYWMDKVHLAQRALPKMIRALERDLPGFNFIPPENYGWHIAKSWLRFVFKERKRFRW